MDSENRAFWDQVGRGITTSALNQMFTDYNPEREGGGVPLGRRGMLADWTWHKVQFLHGAAINPATVQTDLAELYELMPWYRSQRLGVGNISAFVPGRIGSATNDGTTLELEVDGWSSDPYIVRLTRLPSVPLDVKWNGQPAQVEFNSTRKTANVTVTGSGTLRLEL